MLEILLVVHAFLLGIIVETVRQIFAETDDYDDTMSKVREVGERTASRVLLQTQPMSSQLREKRPMQEMRA